MRAQIIRAGRGSSFGPGQWTVMLVVAAVAVTALVMSVLALESGSSSTTTPRPIRAESTANAISDGPVTGTGPGLTALADESILIGIYQRSAPVTGTGPGLIQVADRAAFEIDDVARGRRLGA